MPDRICSVEAGFTSRRIGCRNAAAGNVAAMIRMTRCVAFSAAHADWLPERSVEENRAIFGPAASAEPYGHNYTLAVTVYGGVQPALGIVINIKELDRIVRERIVAPLDRGYFNGRLAAEVVRETARNIFEYRGEDDEIR